MPTRPLKVFLCHASVDKPTVRKLYRYLKERKIDAWLDAEKLLPGQTWRDEIPKAIKCSDAIIVCLSTKSINKEGYVQKEIRFALDKAGEMPLGRIFLIPAKLEECNVPGELADYQWVNLFEEDGYRRLMRSLRARAEQIGATKVSVGQDTILPEVEDVARAKAEREAVDKTEHGKAERDTQEKAEREVAGKAAREKAEREAVEKAEREKAKRDAQAKAERETAEKAAREKAERDEAERDARAKAEREAAAKAAREKAEKAEREKRAQERIETNRRAREATVRSLRNFLPKLKIPALILFPSFIVYLLWRVAAPLLPDVLPQTPVISTQIPSATSTLFIELAAETPIPETKTPVLVTSTPTIIPTPTLGIGATMIGEDGAALVYVPAGEFTMGSESGYDAEKPVHTVYLDAFWIDRTELTNAMYVKCVEAGTCQPPSSTGSSTRSSYYGNSEFDDYPVIYVDWNKAKAYCEWAGRRLPTEAEWEKAARGTDGRTYPWGNESPNSDVLNFNRSTVDTTEVGKYTSGQSIYGIFDMAGNVWEWVADWYDSSYYSKSPSSNPLGPNFGQYRVLRGGSWNNGYNNTRSTNRNKSNPTNTDNIIGFRCARLQ